MFGWWRAFVYFFGGMTSIPLRNGQEDYNITGAWSSEARGESELSKNLNAC